MTLIEDLFNSGYEGMITEVGLGVPLTAMLMEIAGASKFILRAESPYNAAFQRVSGRAVSENNALRLALDSYNLALEKGLPREHKKLFSISLTGTHGSHGDNHAWIAVVIGPNQWTFHFTWPKSYERKAVIELAGETCLRILHHILVQGKLNPMDTVYYGCDAINSDTLSVEEKLSLGCPILYFAPSGQTERPTDVLRVTHAIYRGSFNPPTLAHAQIGGDALFAIDFKNARKGEIEVADMAHRVRMLNLMGKGVLVTNFAAKFVPFHERLKRRGLPDAVSYIVGSDTFKAICEGPHSTPPTELEKLSGTKFLVHLRNGDTALPDTQLNHETFDAVGDFSSSQARSGDFSGLSVEVTNYIKEHNLYERSTNV